jgi:hypothetical protein
MMRTMTKVETRVLYNTKECKAILIAVSNLEFIDKQVIIRHFIKIFFQLNDGNAYYSCWELCFFF